MNFKNIGNIHSTVNLAHSAYSSMIRHRNDGTLHLHKSKIIIKSQRKQIKQERNRKKYVQWWDFFRHKECYSNIITRDRTTEIDCTL